MQKLVIMQDTQVQYFIKLLNPHMQEELKLQDPHTHKCVYTAES